MVKRTTKVFFALSLIIVFVLSMVLVSCQNQTTSTPTPAKTSAAPPPATSAAPPPAASSSVAKPSSIAPAPLTSFAPASPSSTTPPTGGILKIICGSIPAQYGGVKTNFNPNYGIFLFPALETLVGYNKDGPAPTKLATSWDLSQDGNTLTFKLRKGVKFHDGTVFNAAAVKWNLDQLIKTRPELSIISSIDVADDSTVRLNLSSYSNTLLAQLTWSNGLMESPTFAQSHDSAYLANHICGTGPFEFVSYSKDTQAVFKKFNDYWDKGKPYLDGMEWNKVPDQNTGNMAFLAGQGQCWYGAQPRYAKDLKSKGYNVNSIPRVINMAMGDSANPNSPFAKLGVRQALEYAVDKASLTDAFGYGTWETPVEPCTAGMIGYIPNFQGRTYNTAKAKQLIADAGYAKGLQTTISYVDGSYDPNLVQAIQANLKDVGIDAQLQPVNAAKQSTIITTGWQNSIFLQGFAIKSSAAQIYQDNGPTKNTLVSVSISPQYTSLVSQAATAGNPDTQKKLNQQLTQLVYDEAVMIPWTTDSQNVVFTKSVYVDFVTVAFLFCNPGDFWMSK
jgi:peptide/nickel transport system substrate-binding protein